MSEQEQSITRMQTDFKHDNLPFIVELDEDTSIKMMNVGCDQRTNLNSICGFCYSKTESTKVKSLVDLIKLVDFNDVVKYLELDHQTNFSDIVCEDCFGSLLNMDRFKRKCLTARSVFNKSQDNSIEVGEVSSFDTEHESRENNENFTALDRQPNMLHQCFFCLEIKRGTAEYHLHKKLCPVKEVKCIVEGCSQTFISKSGFNTHMNYIHGVIKTSNYTCIKCRTNYQMTAIEFQDHMKKCQQNNEYIQQEIQCDKCKVVCNNLETYLSHKMTHDTKNLTKTIDDNGKTLFRKKEKNNFMCDLCGKLFANSRNIRKHKLNVHLVDFDGVLFSCDLCSVKKPTKRHLYKHMKSVHIVKPTPCEIYGKVYRTRELWQKHSLIHNDLKKNHVCAYCPHKPRFLCKSALQKHYKGSHGECALVNKYQCDFKKCKAS